MDYQTIVNIILGILVSIVGWFAKEIWSTLKIMDADINRVRQEMPVNYVLRETYRDDIKEIKEMLRLIFDRLEHKVDK
jgi:hypothetical protein